MARDLLEALMQTARAAHSQGQFQDALDLFKRAQRALAERDGPENPNPSTYADILAGMGAALFKLGRMLEANEKFKKALQYNPLLCVGDDFASSTSSPSDSEEEQDDEDSTADCALKISLPSDLDKFSPTSGMAMKISARKVFCRWNGENFVSKREIGADVPATLVASEFSDYSTLFMKLDHYAPVHGSVVLRNNWKVQLEGENEEEYNFGFLLIHVLQTSRGSPRLELMLAHSIDEIEMQACMSHLPPRHYPGTDLQWKKADKAAGAGQLLKTASLIFKQSFQMRGISTESDIARKTNCVLGALVFEAVLSGITEPSAIYKSVHEKVQNNPEFAEMVDGPSTFLGRLKSMFGLGVGGCC